ncbi:helix-turn-helix domain-containing protein [Streptomyces sp. 1331.2]|uniref:helix-turn-helix domain-containing protein n=1 Tax=Streptomyces sp. 1331.2 TaxID=1938835 RepID=UPI000BC873F7|nr:helix-turn-helix domain-containing protein [Streptomyces sp. 1331.2]SOB78694.1 transcriptional regulator, AraC family [Streptomyces sp. 1331.2]
MRTGAESALGDGVMTGKDRFELWRDALAKTRECEATSAHADSFQAELRSSALGQVTLLGTSFPSARVRRTERMVRRSHGPELYHLTFLTAGSQALRHGADRTEKHRSGDLVFLDSSHPYDARLFGGGPGKPRIEGVGADFPVSLLPIPPRLLRGLLGRGLPAREGSGALLAQFLLGLDRQADVLQPAEAARLGTVLVDLTAAWLARELDAASQLPPDARHRALVENIRAFIRHNLHDPALTPATIAAAHHISVSHLHRLFTQHSQGETVAAWIRSQRLKKAHRDLTDPALQDLPVHVIAARCGMFRASEFSRAFKTAYGLSPREHRHRARHEPGGR